MSTADPAEAGPETPAIDPVNAAQLRLDCLRLAARSPGIDTKTLVDDAVLIHAFAEKGKTGATTADAEDRNPTRARLAQRAWDGHLPQRDIEVSVLAPRKEGDPKIVAVTALTIFAAGADAPALFGLGDRVRRAIDGKLKEEGIEPAKPLVTARPSIGGEFFIPAPSAADPLGRAATVRIALTLDVEIDREGEREAGGLEPFVLGVAQQGAAGIETLVADAIVRTLRSQRALPLGTIGGKAGGR